jgi:cytidylate kinase
MVSAYPGSAALTEKQRKIGLRKGRYGGAGYRDRGLAGSGFKAFLDASLERARRRSAELRLRGLDVNDHEILEAMRRRDQIDSTRKVAPLVPSAEAIILNQTQDEYSAGLPGKLSC